MSAAAPADAPGTPEALRASAVTVTYGSVVAVREVTLSVPPSRVLAVTGPSGAGKTSLLWALAGALPAGRVQGTVHLGPDRVRERAGAARAGIVLVPQGNGLASSLTARENLLVPLLAAGVPAREAGARTERALEAVGLGEHGDHLPEELSGGQQQRVAVARAVSAAARVLLADEPTSDLDSTSRARVLALLRDEADRGAVVVLTTHDPEAAAEADAQLALDQGVASWVRRL